MKQILKLIPLTIISTLVMAEFNINAIKKDINAKACFIYVPELGNVKGDKNIKINSNNFKLNKENNLLVLNKDITIDFDGGMLKANNAIIDRENSYIKFKNNAEIFLENIYFQAQEGEINQTSELIDLLSGYAFLSEQSLHLSFDKLSGEINSFLNGENIRITSCSSWDDGWQIEAKYLELDNKKKRGRAKNVKIKARNRTVLYLPYLPFPISNERTSGFLEPSVSLSSDGINFEIPYYKVLNRSSDFTISPRRINDRGNGFSFEYRFLRNHEKNPSIKNINFIRKDKKFNNEDRWLISFKDKINIGSSELTIDFKRASDHSSHRDISSSGYFDNTLRKRNLSQNISLSSEKKSSKFEIYYQSYQSMNPILTNGFKKSPSFNLSNFYSFKKFNLENYLDYSRFKSRAVNGFVGYGQSDQKFLRIIEEPYYGERLYFQTKFFKAQNLGHYHLSLEAGFRGINYNVKNLNEDPSNIVSPFYLFKGETSFYKISENGIKIVRPYLIKGYSKYKDQSLNPVFDSYHIDENRIYGINRFAGYDRIGDHDFIAYGFNYDVSKNGKKIFDANISKKVLKSIPRIMLYENIDTHGADSWLVKSSWNIRENISFMFYGAMNDDNKKIDTSGINLRVDSNFGNISYAKRFRRQAGSFDEELNYSELSSNISLNEKTSFYAKYQRDNYTNSRVGFSLGLKYENCCYQVGLYASEQQIFMPEENYLLNQYEFINDAWNNIINLESKNSINFEFTFKGLGSRISSKVRNTSLLNYK